MDESIGGQIVALYKKEKKNALCTSKVCVFMPRFIKKKGEKREKSSKSKVNKRI